MIRCSDKSGCRRTVSRGKNSGTPHEQGWRWTWMFGWRCPTHQPGQPREETDAPTTE